MRIGGSILAAVIVATPLIARLNRFRPGRGEAQGFTGPAGIACSADGALVICSGGGPSVRLGQSDIARVGGPRPPGGSRYGRGCATWRHGEIVRRVRPGRWR